MKKKCTCRIICKFFVYFLGKRNLYTQLRCDSSKLKHLTVTNLWRWWTLSNRIHSFNSHWLLPKQWVFLQKSYIFTLHILLFNCHETNTSNTTVPFFLFSSQRFWYVTPWIFDHVDVVKNTVDWTLSSSWHSHLYMNALETWFLISND